MRLAFKRFLIKFTFSLSLIISLIAKIIASSGSFTEINFKKFLSTLEVVKSRRNKNISEKEISLLHTLYNNSKSKKF